VVTNSLFLEKMVRLLYYNYVSVVVMYISELYDQLQLRSFIVVTKHVYSKKKKKKKKREKKQEVGLKRWLSDFFFNVYYYGREPI
jgi:hypothetical protein